MGAGSRVFCSIIIPTVGRPSLANSVRSALEQNFASDDYEIISDWPEYFLELYDHFLIVDVDPD